MGLEEEMKTQLQIIVPDYITDLGVLLEEFLRTKKFDNLAQNSIK